MRLVQPLLALTLLGSATADCPPMHLPPTWDVRSSVYADVTGDGTPECVLSVWRPFQDWPIARWSAQPTPIRNNHDVWNFSSHVAVLRPLPNGQFRNIWVGSALFQPVTALTVLPDGTLATLETTYGRGRTAPSVALSTWRWTGFGFGLVSRKAVQAQQIGVDTAGKLWVR